MAIVRRTIFVTGTDTHVGKTVVTSFLLAYLRERGISALAMKPFSSGGREDAERLQEIQAGLISLDQCNPYFFRAPLAPLVAARMEGRTIKLEEVIQTIGVMQSRCDILLIEGAGGLMAPLGDGFDFIDVMSQVEGMVLVVAANRLGTLNHTFLTLNQLKRSGISDVRVVLNESGKSDDSCASNFDVLREILGSIPVTRIPYLGAKLHKNKAFKEAQKKMKKVLATLIG